MRVVNQVELVLRGDRYSFEESLPPPESLGEGKRSYLFGSDSPVLEDLRVGRFFSADPSAYIALAYEDLRQTQPSYVVDGNGATVRAYRKGGAMGTSTRLRWVHKTLFLIDELGGRLQVDGYRLNLSINGCVETVLHVESNERGAEFIELLSERFT